MAHEVPPPPTPPPREGAKEGRAVRVATPKTPCVCGGGAEEGRPASGGGGRSREASRGLGEVPQIGVTLGRPGSAG